MSQHASPDESSLKRLADALEQQRASLVEAQRVGKIGSWETDAATLAVEWSEETHRIHGTDPRTFHPTHERFLEIVHPQDREAVHAAFLNSLEPSVGGGTIEHRLLLPDGTIKHVEERWRVKFDAGGHALRVIGTTQDITERKQAELALRESEEKFRQLAENIDDVFWMRSPDMREVHYVSPAFERIWGRPQDCLLREPARWVEFVYPDDRGRVVAAFDDFKRGDRNLELDYRIVRPDGELRWVKVRGFPVRDGKGQLVRLAGTVSDITERRKAEDALRAKELQLSIIHDNAYEIIFMLAPEPGDRFRFISVNRRFENATGLKRAEVVGKLVQDVLPRSSHALVIGKYQDAIRTGRPVFWEEVSEYPAGRRIGEATVTPVFDAHGACTQLICTVRDITERKHAEEVRAALESQLRQAQKMEAVGTLAGGIAHDFNNVLAAILGNVELALADAKGNPALGESLREIRTAARRARDMVQQILSFSRPRQTELKPMVLAPVIEESVRLLRATFPARVAIHVQVSPGTPAVNADATQIQQVLVNLCTNAMQAMEDRAGHIDIMVDTVMLDEALTERHPELRPLLERRAGHAVRLSVRDDGMGMDAVTLRRIFEPFFTTKPPGQGTGLGLPVVHGIVQSHKGAMVVESAPGRGATFAVYLPAFASLPVAASTLPAAAEAGLTPQTGSHILYLDDEASLVFLIERLLRRQGFRVSGFTDQRGALAALAAAPADVDLVVTDYNMPGMSGSEVAREVRLIRPDMPVAIVSGYIDDNLQAQARALGVQEVIFKANEIQGIVDVLARLAQRTTAGPGDSR